MKSEKQKGGHIPVLLNEVIEYLNIKSGSKVIDATLDGGGHTLAILEKFPDVQVLGIEFDPVEYEEFERKATRPNDRSHSVGQESEKQKARLKTVNESYVDMARIVAKHEFYPDAILFDLGVSSWHYESSGRGFSFQREEPLDMRFNPSVQPVAAAEVVNTRSVEELERILDEYGEEQFAQQIARAIVSARKEKVITQTSELVAVISGAVPQWYKHRKIHYATKTFQALRMAVNDELSAIHKGLEQAIEVLNSRGRLVVISFHGLEDKAVREVFKKYVTEGVIRWVTKDTIKPKWAEIKQNPRARSAKMKIIEKLT